MQRIILEGHCPIREAYISELHRHCMNDALARARRDQLDWLLIIDADEFAVPEKGPRRNGIRAALRGLPETVLEARLRTREVVACAAYEDTNWHQNPFFALPERTLHPLGDGSEWTGYLGHNQGQRLVRTSAPVQAYDSHRWTAATDRESAGMPEYRPLPAVEIGWHAHYYLASPEHWLEKFTRHNDFPQHWPAPSKDGESATLPLEQPVAIWRQCVATLTDKPGAALAHARSQLFRSSAALLQLARESLLEEDPALPNALQAAIHRPAATTRERSQAIRLAIPDLAPPPTITSSQIDLCQENLLIHEILLKGFHDWESTAGPPFRWSQPESSISGELPPGNYRLLLDIRKSYFKHGPASDIQLHCESGKIPLRRRIGESRISGRFHHTGGPLSLQFSAPAVPAPGDPRLLGLPLQGIYVKCR